MIRLLALLVLALAVWRLFARRSGPSSTVTIVRADGTARRLGDDDPLAAQIAAVAERVAP